MYLLSNFAIWMILNRVSAHRHWVIIFTQERAPRQAFTYSMST